MGKRIARARKEKDFSLGDLSNLTGISRGNLHRWEKGDIGEAFIEKAPSIAKALSLPILELLYGNSLKEDPIEDIKLAISLLERSLKNVSKKKRKF